MAMITVHVIFYIFAAIAACSAVAVVTVRNPVRSVLSLVVTFFAMAGVWMILTAEFLSLILILVYVGAVMTLFLFVVMMLNIDREDKRAGFVRYLPFGILLTLLMLALIIIALSPHYVGFLQMPLPQPKPADYSDTQALGSLLYTNYAYAFEVAGTLLLAAIIAAITLAYTGPIDRKIQNPSKQISVRPEDRLRIIKMPPEPKPENT